MPNTRPPPVEKKKIQEAIKEAESRKLDFNPNSRAKYIREKVGIIEILIHKGLNEIELRNHIQVRDFVEKYPELFKKIISGDDMSMLRNMLSMLDKMGDGRITQHNASVVIGKELASKYIHIKDTPPDISGSTSETTETTETTQPESN
jgi:hypothetical protein